MIVIEETIKPLNHNAVDKSNVINGFNVRVAKNTLKYHLERAIRSSYLYNRNNSAGFSLDDDIVEKVYTEGQRLQSVDHFKYLSMMFKVEQILHDLD